MMNSFSSPRFLLDFVGLLILSWVLWSLINRVSNAYQSDLRKVPGPWLSRFFRLPLKLAIMSGERYRYIHSLHEKYGPFVRIAPNEIAVADIDASRQIHRIGSNFRKNPAFYQAMGADQLDDNTCGVLMIWDPKIASSRRRPFQQAGTKKNMADWEPQVIELTRMLTLRVKADLAKNGQCDILRWFSLLASDVMGELCFGHSFDSVKNGTNGEMMNDIKTLMPVIGIKMEIPLFYSIFMLLPFSRNHHRRLDNLKKYAGEAVMIPEDGSQTLPDDLVAKEAMNIIVAGVDTTLATLTYMVYTVLKYPEVKRKLTTELQSVPESADADQLGQLTYLNNVIQEAFRLHPAIPGSLPRVVPPEGASFGKVVLPGGTVLATQAYSFQTDPKIFPDPLRFEPDRWLNPTAEMKDHMLIWGGPARSCVGMNIARLEIIHATFRLFRDCSQIKLAPETTDKSMEPLDFFSITPRSGKCIIMPE